ncbi:aspartate aminotransferase family protein [Rhizorhabdus dicambivorans]|nr:aspartate aminotransferase family protein [Rhizorhabdus dicambivorans]
MRDFRAAPRLLASAEGHYYRDVQGREVYDLFSGLWTSGLGHCHPHIVEAVRRQVGELDYGLGFQMSHPLAFGLAERLAALAPNGFSSVFFTNSGSESVDTALKIALAYHRANGESERFRLIGRARGYHGVNFGGMSVGGIAANRRAFGTLLPNVDHLPHTFDLEHNAFSRGQPRWGAHLADELSNICALHDPRSIAALIIEPVAGATGILPPPLGYLERLREICSTHGILLIFDEVITGFGRVGSAFAAERFGVTPDIITTAKGLTNGVIPMGAVLVKQEIHDALMTGPSEMVELAHGYTYSGHPVAAAAALATLDIYEKESSFEAARKLETQFEEALHSLAGLPNVIDVRNFGLMGAVELAPRPGSPGARALEIHKRCFWDERVVVRSAGETIQFAPFLNSRATELVRAIGSVGRVISATD